MGKKSAPKAPDPYQTAQAQADINRLNQYTPYGNLEFGYVGNNGQFSATPVASSPSSVAPQSSIQIDPQYIYKTSTGATVDSRTGLPVNQQTGMTTSGGFTPSYGGGREAVRITESPEQEAIRKQRENLAQTLLNTPVTNTRQIREGLVPLQSLKKGLPSLYGVEDVQAGLTQGGDLGTFRDIGSIASLLPDVNTDFSQQAKEARDATFNLGLSQLSPLMEEQRRREISSLDARGLPVGGEAFNSAVSNLDRGQNDALRNLSLSSILAGNDEASRLFNQSLAARGQEFGIQSGLEGINQNQFQLAEGQRGQRFGEGLGLAQLASSNRSQMFGENTALADRQLQRELGLAGLNQALRNEGAAVGSGMPNFASVPQIDLAGLINQQYMTQAQNASANNQALGGLLGTGLLAGAMMFPPTAPAAVAASDIRLKENIEPAGTENGHKVYTFNYKGDSRRFKGVMAQEVAQTHPEAVIDVNGVLAVNYGAIGVEFKEVA